MRVYDKSVRESKDHVGRYQIVDGEVIPFDEEELGGRLPNDLAGACVSL